MNTFLMRVTLIVLMAASAGCASWTKNLGQSLPAGKMEFHPKTSERVEASSSFIAASKSDDPGCSGSIRLSPAFRLEFFGFASQETRLADRTPLFIRPAFFIRVFVMKESTGEKLVTQGVRDAFFQGVFFNLPKSWCHESIQAVLVSNDGQSIQTANGKIIGPMDVVYNGGQLNGEVNVKLLDEQTEYRRRFFKQHHSKPDGIASIVVMPSELEQRSEAIASAPETKQEEIDDKIFSNVSLTAGVGDILSFPYGPGVKALFLIKNIWQASDGHPHGFTYRRCFTRTELGANLGHLYQVRDGVRKDAVEKCGLRFKEMPWDKEALSVFRQDSNECLDPRTVATTMDVAIKNILKETKKGLQGLQCHSASNEQ